ncbi:hypothetical protein PBI_HILLTOPFARM_92 [Mycobacterium phage Hilltopfarm]|nr:hypothetical protein PBI_HILLTOPFARM_92 [Mycobacterium phage Hilltopfarm]
MLVMDVYVVLYLGPLTPHVVGVSAKLQGAASYQGLIR